MKWCVPINITQLVDVASQNNVKVNDIIDSTDIMSLINAVKNIQFIADFEGVSSNIIIRGFPCELHSCIQRHIFELQSTFISIAFNVKCEKIEDELINALNSYRIQRIILLHLSTCLRFDLLIHSI